MPVRTIITRAVPAVAFLVLGALTRFTLRHVETRFQILAFVALAWAVEGIVRRHGGAPSATRFLIDAAAATVAIVTVKWCLEGTPI